MENVDARNGVPVKRNMIHIEYCTNCQSHNWNTHHNEAKYHETYIKQVKNLIQSSFKPNPPIVTANKVPNYLLPIKQQQNKYYNQLTKKYMFFPNIGSFQITLNQELIFSKKKTNNWPCFETLLNDLSLKINNQPFDTKPKGQKKTETNQTETQFSSDQKIIPQGFKTLYKHQSKNNFKNFGKFTLTDHFKSFHIQNPKKPQENPAPFYFDSSTTIKQSPQNKKNINVEDIDGLRKALMNTNEENDSFVESQKQKKGNEKEILINLCSIEEEGTNTKEMPEFRSSVKKTSAIINSYPLEMTSAYNGSQKSLSLQRFKEINNDLKKIEKQFQHIEKKMIINDEGQGQREDMNEEGEQSRIDYQNGQYDDEANNRHNQSRFVRNKIQSKENYLSYPSRYSKQNKLMSYLANMQASNVKATDRYDSRYISPTYYHENELCKNVPSKKYSDIEKYLKANNEEKNKKLKKIYGDWKVSSNHLNYLYYIDSSKKGLLRDSTNTNSQTKHRYKTKNAQEASDSSPEEATSEDSQSQRNKFATTKNSNNQKSATAQDFQIKKHNSFIIKHKSQHKNVPISNSRPKLSKNSHHEKSTEPQIKFAPSKSGIKPHASTHQTAQFKQSFSKQNSKSFQVSASKVTPKESPFVKREKHEKYEKHESYDNEPKLVEKIQKSKKTAQINEQINQIKEVSEPASLKSGSSISKSNSYPSVFDSYEQSKKTLGRHPNSKDEISLQKLGSQELSQIQEIKEVQMTQLSSQRPQKKVTIEFHQFQLKVKSNRGEVNNVIPSGKSSQKAKGTEQEIEEEQRPETDEKVKTQIEYSKTENLIEKVEDQENCRIDNAVGTQTPRNLAISREVEVKLDQKEINQSRFAKTNQVQESKVSFENSNPQSSVPHLDLNQDEQPDEVKSVEQQREESIQKSKSKSNSQNSAQLQESQEKLPVKGHHRSQSSSLYDQTTFCQAVHHNPDENKHCKCEHNNQQLQTHRKKIEEQRKEKQLIKEKKYEETLRRKELIEKQKQEKLKQLEQQIKEKQNSHPPSKRSSHHSKIDSTHVRSFSKQNLANKESAQTLSKDKRAVSNNVEGPKSPLKNVSNNKNEPKVETRKTQQMFVGHNKPTKSVTETKLPKQKEEILPKKQTTSIDSNSKAAKSQSKNSLPSKASYLSHQVQKVTHTEKPKVQQKEGKSISVPKNEEKPTTLTKKANNQKNKSYFRNQNDKKSQKVSEKAKVQQRDEEHEDETIVQTEEQKGVEGRSKCASIAIQTMGDNQWKKYNSPQKKERTKRNKSVQSKNSSKSMKQPVADEIKQTESKTKQAVKSTYSPIKIEIKDGMTKTKKGKLREKYLAKSKVSQKSKSQCKEESSSEAESQKSIIDKFQQKECPQQVVSQLELENTGLYRGERQKALILNQLYNMTQQLNEEIKHYENLYQTNNLHDVAKKQITTETSNQALRSVHECEQLNLANGEKIAFTQVENTLKVNSKLTLFGNDSVGILKIRSKVPHLTRNFHQVLHVLAQKNELLIVRLFEDYKSETNFEYKENKKSTLLQKSTYGIWLCLNKTWRLISVDNIVPVRVKESKHAEPLFSYHEGNQLWLQILQKAFAQALGGYNRLFSLTIGQIFSILTGSNNLLFTINENRVKNKLFLKEITENDKKNFLMICEKHSLNLKEENQKSTESAKIFYLLSKKIVNNGQSDQILFKMKEQILDKQVQNPEPYYIRYDKFCEKFKSCEVLHLRQHHFFCSLKLNQTSFSNKSKKAEESYFNVIEMSFDEMTFGTITVCNEIKSDLRTYLYKLENSDKQIMKLVGEASKSNKKELFFDCSFQDQRYYLFIQSSNPNTVISFMGEGRPQIKVKEQILSNGLKNQTIEYLPVSNYEGLEKGSVMGRSTNSNFFSGQNQSGKKPRNIQDLREMFIQLLVEERKRR